MISDEDCSIGGPPIPALVDDKPIEDFLTLKERMEVALLVSNDSDAVVSGSESLRSVPLGASGVGSLSPTAFSSW